MKQEFIMQMRPLFGEDEKKAISKYMDEDGFLTEFKHTESFERIIADYVGVDHCIVVNNGTISLTLAALGLGLKPGDEVIVPNYTMIAGPNSMSMVGIDPVLCDVCPNTLCLSLEEIDKKITNKTKAVMLMTANGREPLEGIEAFKRFCEDKEIFLIEDAAQALGSKYSNGKHIGSGSDIASFSFSAPKIISTGQGGALVTNNSELASRIRKLKDFGRSTGGNDFHETIGFNFKFTELQAVIGIEQMKKLDIRVARKKEIYTAYKDGLADIEEVELFDCDLMSNSPWFYDCRVELRGGLMNHLRENGIGTREMYPPINEQPFIKYKDNFPVSKEIGKKGLWIPSQVQLTNDQINYICENIKNFYK